MLGRCRESSLRLWLAVSLCAIRTDKTPEVGSLVDADQSLASFEPVRDINVGPILNQWRWQRHPDDGKEKPCQHRIRDDTQKHAWPDHRRSWEG